MPRNRASRGAIIPLVIGLISLPSFGWGEIYRSNEMGIVFEEISTLRTDEYPYHVSITQEGGREIKTLYHEEEEVRRWVKIRLESGGTEVTEYREGGIEKVTRYDRRERPMEIRFYGEGGVSERLTYEYDQGRITSAVRYDGEGKILKRYRYGHDSTGRLREYREILSTDSGREVAPGTEEISRSRYLYSDGSIREEWHGDESRGDMFRYDDSGRLVLHEGWRDGEIVIRLVRTYSEEGRILTSRESDLEEETVTIGRYEEGRIVREMTETTAGTLIEEITYSYGPGGNLLEKNRRARGIRESWDYTYTGEELTRSVYRRAGEIVKTTEYRNEDDYVETVYRNGEPLVSVEYEDGQKVGEVPVR